MDRGDAALLDRWREALELDQIAEIVEAGPALVTGTGRLRHDGEAVALVARALFAAGREVLARSLVEGARAAPGDDEGAAQLVLARARFDLAEDDLEAVVRRLAPDPAAGVVLRGQAEAWLLVGRALARAGAAERADLYLRRFLGLAPLHHDAPAAWHILATHAAGRRDGDAAGELRLRAESAARWQAYYRARRIQVREHPAAVLPRLGLAQLWLEVDELERAERELRALLELAPQEARAWRLLAEAQRKAERYDEARASYDRALELEPDDLLARHNRAVLALLQERREDAERDLEWIVEHGPRADERTQSAHLLLARSLLARGARERAEHLYAIYRELGGTQPLD